MEEGRPRFLTLIDVSEVLNISLAQARALVHRGDLKGIQIGGRGIWRVEDRELEAYIQRLYDAAEASRSPRGQEADA